MDGKRVPSEMTISETVRNGSTVFVGVVRDTTQRYQLERTEQQMKAKAEFAAAISHEVRSVS
jgi:hypothetical protein